MFPSVLQRTERQLFHPMRSPRVLLSAMSAGQATRPPIMMPHPVLSAETAAADSPNEDHPKRRGEVAAARRRRWKGAGRGTIKQGLLRWPSMVDDHHTSPGENVCSNHYASRHTRGATGAEAPAAARRICRSCSGLLRGL